MKIFSFIKFYFIWAFILKKKFSANLFLKCRDFNESSQNIALKKKNNNSHNITTLFLKYRNVLLVILPDLFYSRNTGISLGKKKIMNLFSNFFPHNFFFFSKYWNNFSPNTYCDFYTYRNIYYGKRIFNVCVTAKKYIILLIFIY